MKLPTWAPLVGLPLVSALHGRFITVSDLHLDEHYVAGAAVSKACHQLKDSSLSNFKTEKAGYYGAPVSDCDAPESLIDVTMQEMERKWKGKVDFVIAMGDFARHDLDSNIPRTMSEIVQLNANITGRLADIFQDVPFVPSIGNNDVWPHNIMRAGPSTMISSIENVWRDFIPEEQFHTFARGGYYAKEVIPNELVVVALNTILWFDNNKVVDGCPPPSKKRKIDPGTEQFRWLTAQLNGWREEGKQVILSGHVPPSDFHPGCRERFDEVLLAFQDTLIASVFGHKNVDTFNYIRHSNAYAQNEHEEDAEGDRLSELSMADDLRSSYDALPRRANEDNFVFWNIAPSIIPTYLPAYRVWSFNTTKESKFHQDLSTSYNTGEDMFLESDEDLSLLYDNSTLDHYNALSYLTQRPLSLQETLDFDVARNKKKKKKSKRRKKKRPSLPRYVSSESPSRKNRFLSLLGYVQYYADLENWNAHAQDRHPRAHPEFEVEYITGEPDLLLVDADKAKKVSSYNLPDLTVGSWLKLAKHVSSSKKSWALYEKYMYVSSRA